MTLHEQVRAQLVHLLGQSTASAQDEAVLNNALRLLAKYRSTLIQNTLIKRQGTRIASGPFAGMDFIERSAEGCHVPKLLGCYEEELHDVLIDLPRRGYRTVLNIGCAEGYYAVGIKRLLPQAAVFAFDIDPHARQACAALAARNGVSVEVGGEFTPADFARYVQQPGEVLLWCDIEGVEMELLDPAKIPALAGMDLVVELHPTAAGHTAEVIPQRFASTHNIEVRHARGHNPVLPQFLQNLGHLDQLLAQWEWRSAPTPWAVMRSKA